MHIKYASCGTHSLGVLRVKKKQKLSEESSMKPSFLQHTFSYLQCIKCVYQTLITNELE